jgi:hypothetical protein
MAEMSTVRVPAQDSRKILVELPSSDRRVLCGTVIKIREKTWQALCGTYWVVSQKRGYAHELDNYFKSLHKAVYEYEFGDVPDGLLVDHATRNKCDFTRLRLGTSQNNACNRSKTLKKTTSIYMGVSKTTSGRWEAGVEINDGQTKKRKRLRSIHACEKEAALAADEYKETLHQDWASLNRDVFPDIRRMYVQRMSASATSSEGSGSGSGSGSSSSESSGSGSDSDYVP